MIALIDGDLLIYRTAFSAENAVQWDDDTYTVQANLQNAQEDFDAMVESILQISECDEAKVAISRPTEENFRVDVWPTYKEQRAPVGRRSGKPILYRAMRDYARTKWNAQERPRMEADDVLGIMATMSGVKKLRVICSIDKDMRTIPGLHYDWRTSHRGVFEVTAAEARRNFYMQVLTGDRTDNYPGLPKCGPVKAAKVLQGCETPREYWDAVIAAYEKGGLTEADALVQARVARILRACDYDFNEKAIRLWTPMRGEV